MENIIKISNETKKKLTADLAAIAQKNDSVVSTVTADDLVSIAQAFPTRHLLDIMYEDGLKEAMKTLIAYYSVPIINFDQEYPMHHGIFNVFHFCAKWVVKSSYDVSHLEEWDLTTATMKLSTRLTVLTPEWSGCEPLKDKQSFLNILNFIKNNWSEDLFGSNLYWILLEILDFPAIDFVDTPEERIRFAKFINELTAFWPETVWNWDDYFSTDDMSAS